MLAATVTERSPHTQKMKLSFLPFQCKGIASKWIGDGIVNDVGADMTQASISKQHKNIHFTRVLFACYNLIVSLFSVLSVLKRM